MRAGASSPRAGGAVAVLDPAGAGSWPWLLAATIPGIVAVGARLLTGARPVDDAYITFRYARNLAEGIGLVYNAGEWVLGTTAPLWAVVLAGAYRLGATDLPAVATTLSALLDGVTAGLLALIGRGLELRPWQVAALGLAWALNPMSIEYAAGGMETSLFVCGALAALVLAVSGRSVAAGGLCGCLFLVRPEAALLAAALAAWLFSRDRRSGVRLAIAAAVAPAVYCLAAIAWYGSPLPQTIAAKQGAYQHPPPWMNTAAFVLQAGLPGWSTFQLSRGQGALVVAAMTLTSYVIVGRAGIAWLRQRALPWLPFASYALLYVLFFAVAGVRGTRLWPWYLVPIIPFHLLLWSAGLAAVARRHAAYLLILPLLWQIPAIDWQRPFLPIGSERLREELYLRVGSDLRQRFPPSTLVAAPEIGALGYSSNFRVLDTVGLISPKAVTYYPLPAEQFFVDSAIPPRLIAEVAPDLIVTLDEFARNSIMADSTFQEQYEVIERYPARIWASQELLVYQRKLAASSGNPVSATPALPHQRRAPA